MTTYDDIFPQSAEELQKEALSIRERREEEQEQAERILDEFLRAAIDMKKICQAHDQCGPQCPLYDKEDKECNVHFLGIDCDCMDPWEWEI